MKPISRIDRVLSWVGLARQTVLNEAERELGKHRTALAALKGELSNDYCIIVAEDNAYLHDLHISDGRALLISPGVRGCSISNVIVANPNNIDAIRAQRAGYGESLSM